MYDWNKVSKRGGGFSSSMPRSLVKELREQEEKAKEAAKNTSLKRKAPDPPSIASTLPTAKDNQNDGARSMADPLSSAPYFYPSLATRTNSSSSEDSMSPKGCYCQMGSVFRAIIFICLILGVTGGLVYWIYMVHFLKDDGTLPDRIAGGTKNSTKYRYPYYRKSDNKTVHRSSINNLLALRNFSGKKKLPIKSLSVMTTQVTNELTSKETSERRYPIMPSIDEMFHEEIFNQTMSKIMKTLAGSSSTRKPSPLKEQEDTVEKKFLKAKDLRVYTDVEGKLHTITELTDQLLLEKKIKLPPTFDLKNKLKYNSSQNKNSNDNNVRNPDTSPQKQHVVTSIPKLKGVDHSGNRLDRKPTNEPTPFHTSPSSIQPLRLEEGKTHAETDRLESEQDENKAVYKPIEIDFKTNVRHSATTKESQTTPTTTTTTTKTFMDMANATEIDPIHTTTDAHLFLKSHDSTDSDYDLEITTDGILFSNEVSTVPPVTENETSPVLDTTTSPKLDETTENGDLTESTTFEIIATTNPFIRVIAGKN